MKFNKILGIALSTAMVSSVLAPMSISAATTSELGITSSVKRVVVRDDKIAALSTPWHESWLISSEVLVSGLTSSQGYTLSYVDKDKKDAKVNIVTDGYIKASKDENTEYIPVVARLDEQEFNVLDGGIYGTEVAFVSQDTGLGGKAKDDKMYVIKANGLPSTTYDWPAKEIRLTNVFDNIDTTLPFTIVFNAYVDDEAVMRLNVGGRNGKSNAEDDKSVTVMTMNAQNGKVRYNNTNSGWCDYTGSFEGGKWHRIALTWDPRNGSISTNTGVNGNIFLSVDGKERAQTLFMGSTSVTSLVIGLDRVGGNGRLAFDDFKRYYGWYDASLDGTTLSVSGADGIEVNSLLGTVIIDPKIHKDMESVLQVLKNVTGENNVTVFENEQYSNEATTLGNGNIAVIKTEEGTYHYLKLSTIPTETTLTALAGSVSEEYDVNGQNVIDAGFVTGEVSLNDAAKFGTVVANFGADVVKSYPFKTAFPNVPTVSGDGNIEFGITITEIPAMYKDTVSVSFTE